jgi:hypothetical protein
MGLLDCLTDAFGESRAMDGIEDWQERNYFPEHKRKLNSQATSKIFSSLTAGQMNHFFTDWVKINMDEGCSVCYDVSSISSYAKDMATVKRGYN